MNQNERLESEFLHGPSVSLCVRGSTMMARHEGWQRVGPFLARTRVPGGWMYVYHCAPAASSVFVPDPEVVQADHADRTTAP